MGSPPPNAPKPNAPPAPPGLARHLAFLLLSLCLPLPARASWWNPWAKPHPSTPALPGQSVQIQFQGASIFSEKKLRDAISEQIRQIRTEGLTRPNADDAAYYLSAFYQDRGYASVDVQWQILPNALRLSIREGARVRLRSLKISGNRFLSTEDVIARLKSPTLERSDTPAASSQFPFVRDDLLRGCSRLLDVYQSEGFLQADISPESFDFSPGGTEADATILVEEGPRFRFGEVSFEGDLGYSKATLLHVLQPLLSLPFTPPRVSEIENSLQKFLTSKGHYEASVKASASPALASAEARVPLLLTIHTGPVYRFEGIEIRGLTRLSPLWVHNRLRSLEGERYNPDLLDSKSRRLMNSGLFEAPPEISLLPQPQQTLRVLVAAREAKARELGFSGGYGSYEGAMLGVRLSDHNLLGRAMQGSIDLAFSQRSLSSELLFSNPWLFETPTEFLSRLFIRSRNERGYDKREGGLRGELSRTLFENRSALPAALAKLPLETLRLTAYAQTRSVEVTSAIVAPEALGKTAYQIASLGLSSVWDNRDAPLNPTSGWIAAALLDSNTLGNGNSFLRSTARLSWHFPLPSHIDFAASMRLGVLSQHSAPPIDERFFLGGGTTVRSFRERELGPRDSRGNPIGGAAYSLANAEASFPLYQNLRAALFFDTGALSESGAQIPLSQFSSALGLGIRYALPVGPLRLDVGFNPDRKPKEDWGAAHLAFGFAF
ncbi:MAG: hypothetical protein RLZZ244_1826 [Verrucomicrobiota bacterium]